MEELVLKTGSRDTLREPTQETLQPYGNKNRTIREVTSLDIAEMLLKVSINFCIR